MYDPYQLFRDLGIKGPSPLYTCDKELFNC